MEQLQDNLEEYDRIQIQIGKHGSDLFILPQYFSYSKVSTGHS